MKPAFFMLATSVAAFKAFFVHSTLAALYAMYASDFPFDYTRRAVRWWGRALVELPHAASRPFGIVCALC